MSTDLEKSLDEVVKVINFTRPLNSKVFKVLCKEARHLLLHTGEHWLSRGNVLNRLFELRDENLKCLNVYAND